MEQTLMPIAPSVAARETLRRLVQLRLPPTPENYARFYDEVAPGSFRPAAADALACLRELAATLEQLDPDAARRAAALREATARGDWREVKMLLLHDWARAAHASDPGWAALVRELVHGWDARTKTITQARKREMLDHVLAAFADSPEKLHARLSGVAKAWNDAMHDGASLPIDVAPARDGDDAAAAMSFAGPAVPSARELAALDAAFDDPAAQICCHLLAEALAAAAASCPADLAEQASALAAEVRAAKCAADVSAFEPKVHKFRDAAMAAGAIEHGIQHGLLRLLQLLSANMSDLMGEDSWLHAQFKAFNVLASGTVSLETIEKLERRLRDIARNQGDLKRGLDDVKGAMKHMVATVIERVGALAAGTGDYHDRLASYAGAIERADDITSLSNLVVLVMDDTRGVQAELARSHDELVAARRTVEEFQERATRLESELIVLSDRLQEDALTELLNRRGLDRTFASEASRADRRGSPMSLAMLDVDNFKSLNDQLGHQAGDAALVHLADCIRATLRASDIAARYGGEEFVVLLPDTPRDIAVTVMTRVQRELTRRFFMHDHRRVLITFSAGVAERVTGESQSDVIARADRALYAAKTSGKNRVIGDESL
jgi:diguanylate cyclase